MSGDEIVTEVTDLTAGNIPSLEISVIAKPNDNGAIYKCTASNRATDSPLETFRKLTVHCKYSFHLCIGPDVKWTCSFPWDFLNVKS